MTDSNKTALNKRAARKQARKNDWDIENIRVCIECGRTVYQSPNIHNPDNQTDKLYCTCESYGVPMVAVTKSAEDG